MTHYKWHDLSGGGHSFSAPAAEPLTGLKPFVAHPAMAVFRAQDEIAAQSRRNVVSWGLRGDAEWRVPNVNPQSNTRTHPDRVTPYVIARGRIDLTPGCFLELCGACVPSGETQRDATPAEVSTNLYFPDGPQGIIRVTIVWYSRDSGDETTVHEVALPPSTLQYGAEDVTDGGMWTNLRDFEIPLMVPPGVPENIEQLARWSRAVTADITVEAIGSPRVVDATISETPVAIAFDLDDPDDEQWAVQHLFASEAGRLTLEQMARHEAGHAIVARELGCVVRFVGISPNGQGGCRFDAHGSAAARAHAESVVAAAGPLAVDLGAATPDAILAAGGAGDLEHIEPTTLSLARILVFRLEDQIARLARALLERPGGTVFGSELDAVTAGGVGG